ncbi:MAG: dephospho-CoA kinase [Lysobacterales bacterium]
MIPGNEHQGAGYTVGLTGGIASGKSTAAEFFAQLGINVIDTDQIARQVVGLGTSGLSSIRKEFGSTVINENGELDRKAMGAVVFADANARQALESIVHPLIWQEVTRLQAISNSVYCVIDVPLLVESGRLQQYDRIVVVDISPAVQRSRLQARDDRSDQEIDQILAAQASREQRLAVADDVLDNNLTKANLLSQVEALDKKLRTLATQR